MKLKLFLWTLIGSAVFSLIPYVLILLLIEQPLNHKSAIFLILFVCSFSILYLVVSVTYGHRNKMKERRNRSE